MNHAVNSRVLRRYFFSHLLSGLRVVWPILLLIISLMATLGCLVALIEHWSVFEGMYFAFVSGLTIGYGDFAPKTILGRLLAIGLGFLGILFTALVAAIGVQALNATIKTHHLEPPAERDAVEDNNSSQKIAK